MLTRILAFIFLSGSAIAGGAVPPVNSDMGCTTPGQVLSYNGTVIMCGAATRSTSTVSQLPACTSANKGAMYMVTDALAPVGLSVVVAGGSVNIGVTCNGTSYVVQ